MFDAQLLFGKAETSVRVYSPWFVRQADNALFTLDLVWIQAPGSLKVRVFHKNREDAGNGTLLGDGEIGLTSAGRVTGEWSGFKELVRYRFSVDVQVVGQAPKVLFRMLSPCWFDTVRSA